MSCTPAEVSRQFWRWFWVGVLAVAVVTGIVIYGWLLGGWFGVHNANRGYTQTVHGQAYQTSLVNEMQQHLKNISDTAVTRAGLPANSPEQPVLRAQQLNELAGFCSEAAQLTIQDPAAAALQAKASGNCSAGVPIIGPPLANPVPAG